MTKLSGWFNQKVHRKDSAKNLQHSPEPQGAPTPISAIPRNGEAQTAASPATPAASPYLIATQGTPTVTIWAPTATNSAIHSYAATIPSTTEGPTAPATSASPTQNAAPNTASAFSTNAIPNEMRPAVLIVRMAAGVYPAALGTAIDKMHGAVLGARGAEYMHTIRISVNRKDVPLAMKLLTNNKAVQYVVPEELLGVASAQH